MSCKCRPCAAQQPGSAATLANPVPRRIAYALVSVLCGITAGLGNARVTANLPQIQGHPA